MVPLPPGSAIWAQRKLVGTDSRTFQWHDHHHGRSDASCDYLQRMIEHQRGNEIEGRVRVSNNPDRPSLGLVSTEEHDAPSFIFFFILISFVFVFFIFYEMGGAAENPHEKGNKNSIQSLFFFPFINATLKEWMGESEGLMVDLKRLPSHLLFLIFF